MDKILRAEAVESQLLLFRDDIIRRADDLGDVFDLLFIIMNCLKRPNLCHTLLLILYSFSYEFSYEIAIKYKI